MGNRLCWVDRKGRKQEAMDSCIAFIINNRYKQANIDYYYRYNADEWIVGPDRQTYDRKYAILMADLLRQTRWADLFGPIDERLEVTIKAEYSDFLKLFLATIPRYVWEQPKTFDGFNELKRGKLSADHYLLMVLYAECECKIYSGGHDLFAPWEYDHSGLFNRLDDIDRELRSGEGSGLNCHFGVFNREHDKPYIMERRKKLHLLKFLRGKETMGAMIKRIRKENGHG